MSKTVILIDDDQDDLDLMKESVLSMYPTYHCQAYLSPVQAIRTLLDSRLSETPQFIFVDINMPVMRGDECVKVLRARREFDKTVITVLSTTIMPKIGENLSRLGADHVYLKPNNYLMYEQILRAVFGNPVD